MKFYDRTKELDLLKKSSRVAVLGRRRIGKTRLLEEAMAGNAVYLFFFNDAAEPFIVEKWLEAVRAKDIYIPNLTKITDILEYLFRNAEHPIIIDEIQNSVKKFPQFISLLQQLIDRFKGQSLYITGSLISLMKNVVEDYRSPIFGRFDFILKLRELDIQTVLEIMTDMGYSAQDALRYYAVFGGIPKYYELIETLKPTDFNRFVNLMFFEYPRPLYNEIYVMLREEIGKEFSNYFGILHAISQSGGTFGTISSALNMPSTSVSKYLNALSADYELVKVVQPVSKRKKKNLYEINSHIIDFWFTFCFSQREKLDMGNDNAVYQLFLKRFPTFYGFKFEEMVIDLLPCWLENRGIAFKNIGKDWNKGYEFDFVVEGESGSDLYIGEIKKGEVNVAVELKKMETAAQQEPFYKNKNLHYMFIGQRFSNKPDAGTIHCIGIDELLSLANRV